MQRIQGLKHLLEQRNFLQLSNEAIKLETDVDLDPEYLRSINRFRIEIQDLMYKKGE